MLSIIVLTDELERPVVATLAALVPGATEGLIREVLLADSSNAEAIARIADVAGCLYVASGDSRAKVLVAGAARATSPWLMFMRAGAVPDPGWIDETMQFIQSVASSGQPRAAVFRYARSPYRRSTWRDFLRAMKRMAGFPSADQGLLIARDHYTRLGGYNPKDVQPEIKLLRRLGRSSLTRLQSRIIFV